MSGFDDVSTGLAPSRVTVVGMMPEKLADLDTTFDTIRAWGAESARDCAFRDPSGNLVRIAQA